MVGCKGDLFELVFRFEESIDGTEFFLFFLLLYILLLYIYLFDYI